MKGIPTFREIGSDDMRAIFDVRAATWHNDRGLEEMAKLGITPDSVREMLRQSHRGWLCEADSRVVGFAMGNKTNGELWVIAVLKPYDGRGIGRRVLTLVEDWLLAEGWHEIWLTTDPDETMRAGGFYRHLGWTDWKLEPDGDRFMRKVLAPSDPPRRPTPGA